MCKLLVQVAAGPAAAVPAAAGPVPTMDVPADAVMPIATAARYDTCSLCYPSERTHAYISVNASLHVAACLEVELEQSSGILMNVVMGPSFFIQGTDSLCLFKGNKLALTWRTLLQ